MVRRLSEKNGENLQQGSNDNEFNLCHILRVMKLKYVVHNPCEFMEFKVSALIYSFLLFFFSSIVDFFKELPQFLVKSGPILSNIYGADWENRLEVLTRYIQGLH